MAEWGMTLDEAAQLPERHALLLMDAYKERKLFEGRAYLMAQVDAQKAQTPKPSLSKVRAMGIRVKDGRNPG